MKVPKNRTYPDYCQGPEGSNCDEDPTGEVDEVVHDADQPEGH